MSIDPLRTTPAILPSIGMGVGPGIPLRSLMVRYRVSTTARPASVRVSHPPRGSWHLFSAQAVQELAKLDHAIISLCWESAVVISSLHARHPVYWCALSLLHESQRWAESGAPNCDYSLCTPIQCLDSLTAGFSAHTHLLSMQLRRRDNWMTFCY